MTTEVFRRPADPPTAAGPAATPGPVRPDESARLNAALDALPADLRLAVELRYRHAAYLPELAAALDCTPAEAAALVARGAAALRAALARP
jgi:DNA-directed RNA polymerase specialized sigma24 family protein